MAKRGRRDRVVSGCHSFRATGITDYLENGRTRDRAQQMAADEAPKNDEALRLHQRRHRAG